ncbi:Alpha/beta hydrolase [Prochlorococcus sp. MIT 0602]|nr:Alpha/beta hydrolase [Prochlorococcus sp. MIT 0602]KGG17680.1 Alpha/beta hydrolase [Prochlorococcus sp. MIT 0603]
MDIASTVTYAHPSWWANNGYLVVIQDVRGQGESEGVFKGFNQERADTTETHKWVRELPECNGLLGTFGFSYQGLTQLLAEPGTPPPECLAPAMTGINERDHWCSEGGAYWWHIGISWGLQLAAQKLRKSNNLKGWEEIRESIESKSYLRYGKELLKKYDSKGMAYQWLKASSQGNNQWMVHKPLDSWIKQPILLIGGWWDPHLNGIIEIYKRSIEAGGDPEIHIGPATHLQWWEGSNQLQLEFFNRHLKKSHTLKDKPHINLWNLTNKSWDAKSKAEEIFSTPEQWSAQSNGLACASTKEGKLVSNRIGKGNIILVHDPWRPVPAIGGHLSPTPGEINREQIDTRGDVATFTTDIFNKEKFINGHPIFELEANSNTKGFDLFISLSIIYKYDSSVNQLSTGVCRILGKDAKIKTKRQVILQPIHAVFPKGSQMRISISGSAWPAIAINPGLAEKQCEAPSPNCLITTIFLDLSKSKLKLNHIFDK